MVYGYCRVSTKIQADGFSLDDQRNTILEKYESAKIVEDVHSAASDRKVLLDLIELLKKGDILVVTKLDRFCRSTEQGLKYIDQLTKKGVSIHILNMGIIEDTPIGRLIVTNLLAFADFERNMIIERTRAGKELARKNPNFREGRPKKYSPVKIEYALDLLETHSYSRVEEITGISKSTLVRAVRARKIRNKVL